MLSIFIAILLVLAGHFALSVWKPGPRATFVWPWGENSHAIINVGGLPKDGGMFAMLLGSLSAVAFVVAFLSLFGWLVPAAWFVPAVISGCVASLLLFVAFFSSTAILPILVDVVLLVGVLLLDWSPATV